MKTALLLISAVILFAPSCKTPQSLYSGNVGDWIMSGQSEWSFSSTEIIGEATGDMGFLVSSKDYEDFELSLEFMPDANINSGVFIKCQSDNINPDDCYEINIWDSNPKTENRSGSIVRRVPSNQEVITINKWNTMTIKSKNGKVVAKVNGKKTATLNGDDWPAGPIALQAGGQGKIKFKNISIK